MKTILIYVPAHAIAMSAMLIRDLCWVATGHAAHKKGEAGRQSDHVHLVSHDGQAVRDFTGHSIAVDMALADTPPADAIFLCAFWGANQTVVDDNAQLIPWLQQTQNRESTMVGVSNGQLFMAEAGLLDHKLATVYPEVADGFRQRYPQVTLQPERAITNAGNLYCANGIASGCDLIVSIIEQLYGGEVARQMSREFLLGFNRSYSLSSVSLDGQKYHQDKHILEAQQWLESHYGDDIKLRVLAESLGMSPRNFSRRFQRATGGSPREYLLRVRMEVAKERLRTTQLQVAEIAYQVGYSDLSYFSRIFNRSEGCMPHTFREEVTQLSGQSTRPA